MRGRMGGMLRPKVISDAVYLPAKTEAGLVALLNGGPFDLVPLAPLGVESKLQWQAYFCHHNDAIVSVSFARLKDTDEPALITVSTCRELLHAWIRRRDRKLVYTVIDFLLENGAYPTPGTATHRV
jgi:hypothetical protein